MSDYGPEPKDPIDAYDSSHGKPSGPIPVPSADEAWGEKLNPVRETPLAGTGLKDVGR